MRKSKTEFVTRQIWVIRPGRKSSPRKNREHEYQFFQNGVAGICDEYCLGDLREGKRTRDDLFAMVASGNSEMNRMAVGNVVAKLTKLLTEMQIGDWVLCPSRIAKEYRVGIVESEYRFDAKATFQHNRDVRWLGGIAKDLLSIAAQRELGAARLFFVCKRCADEVASHLGPLIEEHSQ